MRACWEYLPLAVALLNRLSPQSPRAHLFDFWARKLNFVCLFAWQRVFWRRCRKFCFRTQCGKQANCNANTLLCVYASLDRYINLDWWVSALVSIDSGCYMRGGMQCNNRQTKKKKAHSRLCHWQVALYGDIYYIRYLCQCTRSFKFTCKLKKAKIGCIRFMIMIRGRHQWFMYVSCRCWIRSWF